MRWVLMLVQLLSSAYLHGSTKLASDKGSSSGYFAEIFPVLNLVLFVFILNNKRVPPGSCGLSNYDWYRDLQIVMTKETVKIISILFTLDNYGERAYESYHYSQIFALAYLDTNFTLILNVTYDSISYFYPTEGIYNSDEFLETMEA